jgi:hypothetical protein
MLQDIEDNLVEGINRLRTGAIIQIFSFIIFIISFLIIVVWGFQYITYSYVIKVLGKAPLYMSLLRILTLLLITLPTIIILLLGFYQWLKASRHLKIYDIERLSMGGIGIIIIIIGLIILLIVVIGLISGVVHSINIAMDMIQETPRPSNIPSEVMRYLIELLDLLILPSIIGWGLLMTGTTIFSIMLIRLGNMKNISNSIRNAGNIFIISMVLSLIPIISFIDLSRYIRLFNIGIISGALYFAGLIILYIGSNESISKLMG